MSNQTATKTHKEDELLNLTEVGQALGRDPSTIGRWVKEGLMRAIYTPSGLPRVRRSELNKWLDATGFATVPGNEGVAERVKQLKGEPE